MVLKHLVIVLTLIAFVLLLSLALTVHGLSLYIPPYNLRDIAYWFLSTTYNPLNRIFSAMAPEGVTAIVWDYRGLDTVFETFVLYLAIIASVAIMRGIEYRKEYTEYAGMSVIGKAATRILVPLIVGVAASIALHGHLTPGGGFQGGAAAAVAPLLVLVIFSKYFLEKLKITKNSMLMLRSIGLLGIAATSVLVLIMSLITGKPGYILQNQPKASAPIGMPYAIDDTLIGGTLLLFNVFETLAVAAGFTVLFLLLAIPEHVVHNILRGEKEHG